LDEARRPGQLLVDKPVLDGKREPISRSACLTSVAVALTICSVDPGVVDGH
jgi:hypothetical protein